jgi:SpoVK/Ycf46/Vps4 family AAA+-type ATPase
VATESNASFFSISASSLTSKWVGEGEKMVRALFVVARRCQPTVIFVDEIDSMLSARTSGENEASRRLKTEFLVQMDGCAAGDPNERLLVIGATNRPQELDDAVIRRLTKRIYVPLPGTDARTGLFDRLMHGQVHDLGRRNVGWLIKVTAGYSASDMTALCKEAAMGPVRDLDVTQIASMSARDVRPIMVNDFKNALLIIRPSVSKAALAECEAWCKEFGSSGS